jgi:hypothetical protein
MGVPEIRALEEDFGHEHAIFVVGLMREEGRKEKGWMAYMSYNN